jgi:hypothetical protein
VVQGAENAKNFKEFFVSRLIADAIFARDIRIIKQLINRIDGASPKDTDKGLFKTRLSDVLDVILNYTDNKQLEIQPGDMPILAIGKVVAFLALQSSKSLRTTEARNVKNAAVEIILDRCGGRKTTPLRGDLSVEYAEPEWLTEPTE